RGKHVPISTEDDVERTVQVRHCLYVTFEELHIDLRNGGVVVRALDQRRRQIKAGRLRTQARRSDSDHPCSACYIEYTLSGIDLCKFHQLCRRDCGECFKWRERRPSLTLCCFEIGKRIGGPGWALFSHSSSHFAHPQNRWAATLLDG